MKKTLLFLIALFIVQLAAAQLKVSVNNVHYCPTIPDGPGAQLTAEVVGGTPPYTYCWDTEPYTGLNELSPNLPIIYTSGMMNDTAVFNPIVFRQYANPAYFVVTVTDANHQMVTDTAIVTRSYWGMSMSPSGPTTFNIALGDSVWLPGSITIFPEWEMGENATVIWSPETGLNEVITPYNSGVWAKPETTTEYSMNIIDAAGCEMRDPYEYTVLVGATNIQENAPSLEITLLPNPTTRYVLIENNTNEEIQSLCMYDLTGKKYLVSWKENKIDLSHFPQGIYIVEMTFDDQVISKKVVKH